MIKMPIPTKKRALELGATFLESDLHAMRRRAIEQYEHQQDAHGEEWDGREFPIGSSHEGDLMKAVEWAWAAATLRAMAGKSHEVLCLRS
jgi:hypothetical protein